MESSSSALPYYCSQTDADENRPPSRLYHPTSAVPSMPHKRFPTKGVAAPQHASLTCLERGDVCRRDVDSIRRRPPEGLHTISLACPSNTVDTKPPLDQCNVGDNQPLPVFAPGSSARVRSRSDTGPESRPCAAGEATAAGAREHSHCSCLTTFVPDDTYVVRPSHGRTIVESM